VYDIVTEKIVSMLEAGTIPWRRPWTVENRMPANLVSKKAYRGINTFLLGATAMARGYSSPWWVTFKQAADLGGHVRKGEKATIAVFWKMTEHQDSETGETKEVPLLRYFNIFNLDQTEGIAAPAETETGSTFTPIETAERIVSDMPNRPEIRHGGDRAYYSPLLDYVQLPHPESFAQPENYYATAFHEITHSTGHKSRLDRGLGERLAPFGSPDYSREELIAEMGAAFLCACAGIEPATLDNSAAYLASWVEVLKGDSGIAVHAAAQAQRAADYILERHSE
jgi:antirestriction protein ArdC